MWCWRGCGSSCIICARGDMIVSVRERVCTLGPLTHVGEGSRPFSQAPLCSLSFESQSVSTRQAGEDRELTRAESGMAVVAKR